MSILEEVNQLLVNCDKAIVFAKGKLKISPEGTLYTRIEKGEIRYYSRIKDKKKYISRTHPETIKALEEKDYCTKLQITASKEKEDLQTIKRLLESLGDWEQEFLNIPQEKRNLIEPFELQNIKVSNQDVLFWKSKIYPMKNKNPGNLVTSNGEKVRSKSELIIAEKLKTAGVPYFYEGEISLFSDETRMVVAVHPDFRVLNIYTKKEYFWEHLGLLDNPEYYESTQKKLETYARNGIFIGEKLIITMETSQKPLNTEYVDLLIKKFLLS